jgi:hypothetical protein
MCQGFTQAQFAARSGFALAGLRSRQNSDRSSHGVSQGLLNVIDRYPCAAMQTPG